LATFRKLRSASRMSWCNNSVRYDLRLDNSFTFVSFLFSRDRFGRFDRF
jgi:hypothetical protein